MLKNLKIDAATHRRLSMKAASLDAYRGLLAEVLINAALDRLTDEQIQHLLDNSVTSNGNSTGKKKGT